MSDNIIQTGWDRRRADYTKAHGDSSEAFSALLNAMNLKKGMAVADIMGGYGDVTKQVLDYCSKKGISISLTLSDKFAEQIERSYGYLKGHIVERKIEDARELAFKDASLDKIVIKMGLHEVKKEDQIRVASEMYRSLKLGGEAYVWESLGDSDYLAYFWKGIVRQKDLLAGFTSLVENRYFPSEQELIDILRVAGFKDIQRVYCGEFKYITKNLLTDFNGDLAKLDAWNEFLRQRLPDDVKKAINFKDEGDSISMSFSKVILRARR
jgi:ubiquinone/menaquinone biosynthesis C-methylase UbiE